MTEARLRVVLRWVHIIAGIYLTPIIYAADVREHTGYIWVAQWIVVPIIAVSGTINWQMPRLKRWVRRSPR